MRGLTSKELAVAAQVSIATISKMEQCSEKRKGNINITSACLVARALGVAVDEVFPNTELTEVGRPAQTGGSYGDHAERKIATCAECGTQVSNRERSDGLSDCCSAKLVA